MWNKDKVHKETEMNIEKTIKNHTKIQIKEIKRRIKKAVKSLEFSITTSSLLAPSYTDWNKVKEYFTNLGFSFKVNERQTEVSIEW